MAADHGQINCSSTITITTATDIRYLDALQTLVSRWKAPISVALYAPGDDLPVTVNSIHYLRNCVNESPLIREFVSFHLFFEADHITQDVSDLTEMIYHESQITND